MKRMKRIIALLMILTLAMGLCSCGKDALPAEAPILTAEQIRAAETAAVRELAERLFAEMQAGTPPPKASGRAMSPKRRRPPSRPTKRTST